MKTFFYKIIISMTVISIACISLFAADDSRVAIDNLLKEYENVVVKVESMGSNYNLADFLALQQKITAMNEQANKIQTISVWTLDDTQKYLALTQRYSDACAKLQNATMTVTPTDAADILKAAGM